MAQNFDQPGSLGSVAPDFSLTAVMVAWISRVHTIATSQQQSGPTAERPVKLIWIGRRFFDTDLGIPIWVQSYAAGVAVWVDATGAPV